MKEAAHAIAGTRVGTAVVLLVGVQAGFPARGVRRERRGPAQQVLRPDLRGNHLVSLKKRNEKTNFSGTRGRRDCTNGLMQAFVRLSPTDGTCIGGDLVF